MDELATALGKQNDSQEGRCVKKISMKETSNSINFKSQGFP